MQVEKICCFGAGFVGIPTMAVLAVKNPEKNFVVYDISKQRVELCALCKPPIHEQGLEELLKNVNNLNLSFTNQIGSALDQSSIIFLALPTPTKNFGEQKGKAYDMSYTQSAVRSIIKYYNQHPMESKVIIVQKSTVAIGTAQSLEELVTAVSIPENRGKYIITSNPQFLAEGTAVQNLLSPDRIVIGSKIHDDVSKLIDLYGFVGKDKIILTNQTSSQLSKLAANCFLAQRVSSINSIALLCEQYPSEVQEVRKCIGADKRIGDNFLQSSVGFGGSCFKKDIFALIYLAEIKGLTEVANYWSAVLEMNEYRKKSFFLRVFNALNKTIKNKTITVFGTAFKKNTNDVRETPAVEICHYLLEEGAFLKIFDPQIELQNFINEIKLHELWKEKYSNRICAARNPFEAVVQSQAILVLTEWDIFKTYDYALFYSKMEKPAFLFDGRKLLKRQQITKAGFTYFEVGSN